MISIIKTYKVKRKASESQIWSESVQIILPP